MPASARTHRVLLLAWLVVAAGAWAQESTFRMNCQLAGSALPEPLGDREGHSLTTSQITCRVEGGPMDGGVMTGYAVYEWQGPRANGVGLGVVRKPGSALVYVNTEMNSALTMDNGKVIGATGSGKGHYSVATGSANSLQGKTYSYSFKSVGFNQLTIDVKVD
jgi:hypothetical protein